MLRSRDLLWTPAVNTYLRGKRDSPNDLMAWNADGTRMPCRMHAEYLRQLYLNNALAQRRVRSAEGRRVDLSDIRVPMFVVGTETDHVAPWQSVYKARGLTRSPDYTFLLTSGGHNAGIVSGPTHPRRRHRVRTWLNDTETLDAPAWLESTAARGGLLVAGVGTLARGAFRRAARRRLPRWAPRRTAMRRIEPMHPASTSGRR